MTTFVDTSVLLSGLQAEDQDPVVVVVRSAQGMLREGLGETESVIFERNFSAEYSSKNWASVFDLLLSNAETVFKKLVGDSSVADRISKTAEGYFEVALSILSKLESVDEVVSRINSFISTMSAETREDTAGLAVKSLKFKLLTTLLNTLSPKAQLRLTVAKGLCQFAKNNGEKFNPQVFALVKNCDLWISENEAEWDVSVDAKKEMFSLVQTIASQDEDRVKYMKLQAELATEPQRQKLIEETIIESIGAEHIFRFSDLLPLAKELSSGSNKVAEFFSKFVSGKNICGDIPSFEEFKLDKERVLNKMRVLALVSHLIDTTKSSDEVSLADIGDALKTSDPFSVIVEAFRAGLVRGSIDQVRGVLNVKAVATRHGEGDDELVQILNRMKQQ